MLADGDLERSEYQELCSQAEKEIRQLESVHLNLRFVQTAQKRTAIFDGALFDLLFF